MLTRQRLNRVLLQKLPGFVNVQDQFSMEGGAINTESNQTLKEQLSDDTSQEEENQSDIKT